MQENTWKQSNPLASTRQYLNKHYKLARLKYLDNRVFLRYCFTCLNVPAATSPTKREIDSDAKLELQKKD